MITKEYKIDGMGCQHCILAVNNELANIGINDKNVSVGLAKVSFDETKITERDIVSAIKEAGFEVVE